jgi:hypothetical protein
MTTGKKEFDGNLKYRSGDKAAHEKDLANRIKAWQEATKKRFGGTEVEYQYNKEKDGQKDEWFGVFKKSIADVKPDKAPFVPTITNVTFFKQLIKEAYEELDSRKDKILPAKEHLWLDLLRNVYEETKKIKQ